MVPQSESQMTSSHQQPPIKNNGLHFVYVRRKQESEQNKNTISNKSKDLPIELSDDDENNHEQEKKQEQEQEKTPMKDSPKNIQNWEERYSLLQNFLKVVDQSTQYDYRQMLRSLSSVDLSRVAVELERRTIRLSMEEAKEVQRAKLLDVGLEVHGVRDSKK